MSKSACFISCLLAVTISASSDAEELLATNPEDYADNDPSFIVTVPAFINPGQEATITSPNGEIFSFLVPPGVMPGTDITIMPVPTSTQIPLCFLVKSDVTDADTIATPGRKVLQTNDASRNLFVGTTNRNFRKDIEGEARNLRQGSVPFFTNFRGTNNADADANAERKLWSAQTTNIVNFREERNLFGPYARVLQTNDAIYEWCNSNCNTEDHEDCAAKCEPSSDRAACDTAAEAAYGGPDESRNLGHRTGAYRNFRDDPARNLRGRQLFIRRPLRRAVRRGVITSGVVRAVARPRQRCYYNGFRVLVCAYS